MRARRTDDSHSAREKSQPRKGQLGCWTLCFIVVALVMSSTSSLIALCKPVIGDVVFWNVLF